MRKHRMLAAGAALLLAGLTGCLQPIPNGDAEGTGSGSATKAMRGVLPGAYPVYTFYDEDYQLGGFTYTYGGSTKVGQKSGVGAEGSEYFLNFKLDQKEYSGAAVCLWNMSYDVTPYMKSGALVLWVRGKNGAEKVSFGLVDDEKSDGWKTVVKVSLAKYATVKKGEWTQFVVPLRDFGKRGVAWDAANGVEKPMPFQWDNVQEFRIITNLNDNPECDIDIDNVQIVADAIDPTIKSNEEDWQDRDRTSDAPAPASMVLPDEVAYTFFEEDLPAGGFTYNYGGRTTNKTLESTTPGNAQVWAAYLENDYSGVSLSGGNRKFMDLSGIRKTGALNFWIKGGPASTKFMIGLIDFQGGEKKVQTKVMGNDYAVIKEGEWVQIRIPLKRFSDDGTWWDAKQGREISAKMDWSKIQEVRLSIARDENKPGVGKPVIFYLDQIQVTKTAKGIYDPDAYWDAFKSSEPDALITDFDGKDNAAWKSQHGTTAEISMTIGTAGVPKTTNGIVKGNALKTTFKPGDWFDILAQLPNMDKKVKADWSKHYAVSFWLYTDKPFQSVDVTIQDRDHEYFVAQAGATKGWNQVVVPFRNFFKFPYYQPPEAKQNNLLDLDGVFQLGFKPGGEVAGELYIDNIFVTNQREVVRIVGPAQANATATGSLTKVLKDKVPDIFGINVGLWAPEMLDEHSAELIKPMNLGTVRYPGGLRSDEEDWKKTLAAKDFHVDTDEFLDWAAKMGVETMFTANVGDGTPEMAAEWVKYVNFTRKGPKVKNWEIGNEVYGNWHKYYERWGTDGGVAYGKRVREFAIAMKAVDPSIHITAVWQLTGKWNENVLKECADVIDGVNVHHYAQKAGTDNDQALLAVSGEADLVIHDVTEQLEKYGVKGKHYELWLTEWNSVDFNPGPQILSHINAVFVADYLGHIANTKVTKANLWALYNGRDKRMGDYGVLATSGDPHGLNKTRPTYWAIRMLANTMKGKLLSISTGREDLESWLTQDAQGKAGIVFVNKNQDTEYKTTLKIPGLKGTAIIETLTEQNSYTGPTVETKEVADGSVISVPKYGVVVVRFQ